MGSSLGIARIDYSRGRQQHVIERPLSPRTLDIQRLAAVYIVQKNHLDPPIATGSVFERRSEQPGPRRLKFILLVRSNNSSATDTQYCDSAREHVSYYC
jgi:hypothetical protein